jgi:predicted nucleic acid-binding protein
MPVAAVVGDANVLLSAVIGKAALRVITDFGIAVHVTQFNADEVARYLPVMAEKYSIPEELVQLQWRVLPVQFHAVARYSRYLAKARRDLAQRDPEDAHPLALARALKLPLWTNDHDLEGQGVECWPTARLLKMLASA